MKNIQEIRKQLRYHTLNLCWKNIKQRCYNKKNPTYKYYGAKGILMSKEWKDSFKRFYEDMTPGWEPGLEIDRIDTYGGYNKENCAWVTKHENITKSRRKGAKRKSRAGLPSDIQIATHITKPEYDVFTKGARQRGLSISALLRQAVVYYIKTK